jgi:hypothetical protein
MKVYKAQVTTSIRNLVADFVWVETLSKSSKFINSIPNFELEILKERLRACDKLVEDILNIMEKYV